jgi:large subunit ribosomal protein L22
MEARAIAKYVRISTRKANEVLGLIRGLPVDSAEEVLQYSTKPFARVVKKILKSAVSNMTQRDEHPPLEDMVVAEAVAGPAPTIKKVMPRARGRASRIFRRFAHIRIVVAGEEASKDGKKSKNSKTSKKVG